MNTDRVKGNVKDVAGRIERQAGEWTGDPKKQVKGAAKQVEGKLQNAWGKAKDVTQKESEDSKTPSKPPHRVPDVTDSKQEPQENRRSQR